MASSYSTDLKIELMATGENSNTWGDKTNNNWDLIQQAVAGYQSVALTSTSTTLAMTDGVLSNARNMVLEFTGTLIGNSTINLPDGIEKFYLIKDSTVHGTANTLTFKTTTGTGFNTENGKTYFAYSNGSAITGVTLSNLGGTIATASIDDSAITSAKIASTAVTTAKIADSNVTKTKLENIASYKVLGNTTAVSTNPQEVAILNEINMSSNSSTSLVTQSSVKSYVDTSIAALPSPKNPKFVTVNYSGTTSFTTTTTFNLNNLTINGTTNNKSNLVGLYIYCAIGPVAYNNSTDWNISATYPDASVDRIFAFKSSGSSQGAARNAASLVYLPVNGSLQSEVLISTNITNSTLGSFTLKGASYLSA